ncbi:hypothetical protein ACLMJK_003624 [Lecanora helva]
MSGELPKRKSSTALEKARKDNPYTLEHDTMEEASSKRFKIDDSNAPYLLAKEDKQTQPEESSTRIKIEDSDASYSSAQEYQLPPNEASCKRVKTEDFDESCLPLEEDKQAEDEESFKRNEIEDSNAASLPMKEQDKQIKHGEAACLTETARPQENDDRVSSISLDDSSDLSSLASADFDSDDFSEMQDDYEPRVPLPAQRQPLAALQRQPPAILQRQPPVILQRQPPAILQRQTLAQAVESSWWKNARDRDMNTPFQFSREGSRYALLRHVPEPRWHPYVPVITGYLLNWDNFSGRGLVLENQEGGAQRPINIRDILPHYGALMWGAMVQYQWSDYSRFHNFYVVQPQLYLTEACVDLNDYPYLKSDEQRKNPYADFPEKRRLQAIQDASQQAAKNENKNAGDNVTSDGKARATFERAMGSKDKNEDAGDNVALDSRARTTFERAMSSKNENKDAGDNVALDARARATFERAMGSKDQDKDEGEAT